MFEHGDAPICLKAFRSCCCRLWKSIFAASLRAMTFTSTAGKLQRVLLNVSLIYRLILLRVTAQPTFLLTVTPRRAYAWVLACHTTSIPLAAYFCTEPARLRNSERLRSLTTGGKVVSAIMIRKRYRNYFVAMRTERFFLPFALLRLITRRPFLLAIRTRKPWVLLREVLLG